VNPHDGHLYCLPKSLHFSQRQIVTAPQLGQENFIAFSPGEIFLPQDMHVLIVFHV
jgi:hypothetical protein